MSAPPRVDEIEALPQRVPRAKSRKVEALNGGAAAQSVPVKVEALNGGAAQSAPAPALEAGTNLQLVDGSTLNGGGQILRNSVALSVLLGHPIRVNKIRAGHGPEKGGLRPQHLHCVHLLRDLGDALCSGDSVGSDDITFRPKTLRSGEFEADTQTAGSCTLLAQASLPAVEFATSRCSTILRGGTDVPFSPPSSELCMVLMPLLERWFGIQTVVTVQKRGVYPRGGGTLRLEAPGRTTPLRSVVALDPGVPTRVAIRAYGAGATKLATVQQATKAAVDAINARWSGVPASVETTQEPILQAGNKQQVLQISVAVETSTNCLHGGSAIHCGKGAPNPSKLGIEAAEMAMNSIETGACVDEFVQDQIIIFMALAQGASSVRMGKLTPHTETALVIVGQLTGVKFSVTPAESGCVIVSCDGLAFSRSK